MTAAVEVASVQVEVELGEDAGVEYSAMTGADEVVYIPVLLVAGIAGVEPPVTSGGEDAGLGLFDVTAPGGAGVSENDDVLREVE